MKTLSIFFNRKRLMGIICAVMFGVASVHSANTKTIYTFDVFRTIGQTEVSVCKTNTSVLANVLNCTEQGSFKTALDKSVVKLYAVNAAGIYSGKQGLSLYFRTMDCRWQLQIMPRLLLQHLMANQLSILTPTMICSQTERTIR